MSLDEPGSEKITKCLKKLFYDCNFLGATTLSKMTFSIMTWGANGCYA